MLMPNKTKYRKVRKGKIKGVASKANELAYGKYGIQSMQPHRISSRQIESARQAMTRYTKRGGVIWIRIFPHTEYFAAKVKPGTVLFEMDGITEQEAREAMRLAAHKLPVKTRFITKEDHLS